jgi:hypothetical protein
VSAARDFARQQFDWLKQVQDDPSISCSAFALAFAICRHVNADRRAAWPTQETLARLIHVNIRTVRRLAEELAAAGHLTIEVQRRRHDANVYRLSFLDRTSVTALTDARPDADVRPKAVETGHFEQLDRTFSTSRPDTHALQNTSRNTLIEHRPVSPAADAAFNGQKNPEPTSAIIPSQDADLYRRGKEILGSNAGGLIKQLVLAKGGSLAQARAAIEQASEKHDPREYIGAIIRRRDGPEDLRARGDAW